MDISEKILIIDFGGQYNQTIARRVREESVYAVVKSYKITKEEVVTMNPQGIILTGGPNSVYGSSALHFDKEILDLTIPVLGICYGAQLIAHMLGGRVETAPVSEYGKTVMHHKHNSKLFTNVPGKSVVWMSHTDYISEVPKDFTVTASTDVCPIAAMEDNTKKIYAIQAHPEVHHTEYGRDILKAFVKNVCECKGTWRVESFTQSKIKEIRETVKDGKVLLALSGGVDSSVAAALLSKAIGKQLTCVFVDHGLLRKNEAKEVENIFNNYDLNFIKIDARKRFLEKLESISEPEKKRKIIGEEFIRVFEEESKRIGKVDFLAQGTIYSDVVESGLGDSATIKSHHNVGGLPDYVDFKEIIEPLRDLFKDEVRKVGLELDLPENLVNRQPFPGPGLAIRIIGDITEEKIRIVQEADYIYREEIRKANLKEMPSQYFAALTNMRSVGVMGDFRTYDYAIVLRAVHTSDFMTATSVNIPWEVLEKVTSKIVNEVTGVNRVLYDLTGKPPATIEWE